MICDTGALSFPSPRLQDQEIDGAGSTLCPVQIWGWFRDICHVDTTRHLYSVGIGDKNTKVP